jgi:hypothetical protein
MNLVQWFTIKKNFLPVVDLSPTDRKNFVAGSSNPNPSVAKLQSTRRAPRRPGAVGEGCRPEKTAATLPRHRPAPPLAHQLPAALPPPEASGDITSSASSSRTLASQSREHHFFIDAEAFAGRRRTGIEELSSSTTGSDAATSWYTGSWTQPPRHL